MEGFKQFVRRLFRSSSSETSTISNSVERRREEVQQPEVEEGTRNGAAASVTVELDVLDCTVCWQPLHPPVFQCALGHLICSSCLAKLPNKEKCHYCSRRGDYNRSYCMEKVLGSIQVPCSNGKYGCTVKASYYQKQDHEATCPHAPCFCPGSGCSFRGTSRVLLGHFTTEHHWPSTNFRYWTFFSINLREGVHALFSDDGHLFLVNMASEPSGCLVSVFWVQHCDTKLKFRCFLYFGSWKSSTHTQSSEFQVPSTALSDGMPQDYSMFIVPKFYLEEDSKINVFMKNILT